ncbi:type III secretion protein [Pseudomonas huanghezhanensis]|uniref:type III secretion protein n=1 Tax=Pseudomonas huanghezhanensis TaxID=3002903 RepID=UPI0022865F92|nr:type III secretion protein [Pseudomonas sp. BSw22131]
MKLTLWLLLTVLTSTGVRAEDGPASDDPNWFAEPYAYVLVEQDVRAALEEFGHNLGLIVVMSDKVRGKSRSSVRGESAGDFLTQLCDTNGLSWYFDGNILYLSADAETGTRLFKAQAQNLEQLEDYLASLDVYGKQMSTRASPDGDELFVSGPPAYLNMVQQHVDHQQRPVATPVARERGVRVFRGGVVTTEASN